MSSSLEEKTSLKTFLKSLNLISNVLIYRIDDNRPLQEITIEGLQSNLTRNVKAKEVALEELKKKLIKNAKVQ